MTDIPTQHKGPKFCIEVLGAQSCGHCTTSCQSETPLPLPGFHLENPSSRMRNLYIFNDSQLSKPGLPPLAIPVHPAS